MRWLVALAFAAPLAANAQQNQCRTSPVGASTAYCASEAFVTETAAAVPVGLPATTKAQQQAATSDVVAVTPLHQQDHDSAAKAWASVANSGINGAQSINIGYGVSGVTRSGTGQFAITFSTSFTSASNYACLLTGEEGAAQILGTLENSTRTAAAVTVIFSTANGVAGDPLVFDIVCYGRQ